MMPPDSGWDAALVHFPLALIVTGAVWRALLGDAEGEVPGC
jgi:hypothetical protein